MSSIPKTLGKGTVGLIAVLLVAALVGSVAVGAAGTTSVSLSPTDETLQPGETTTFDVVVEDADGGVGAYTATVAVDDPSVATITAVELHGSPQLNDIEYAEDNSSVTINAALMNTDDTGGVTIATVTVEGEAAGETDVSLDVSALGDEEGNSYDVAGTPDASLSVTDGSDPADPAAVSISQTPATDSAEPGETVTFEATIDATDLNAPGVDVDLPVGWSIESQSADGQATYKDSEHQWVWLSGGEYTVEYIVAIPEDAAPGDHQIDVEGSAINPETDQRLVDTTISTVTVEETTSEDGDGDESDDAEETNGDESDDAEETNGDESDGDDPDGDESDGDDPDGDECPDDDEKAAGDEGDGNGDETNGDETNGDETNGDDASGDETNGDDASGDETNGDESDGAGDDGDTDSAGVGDETDAEGSADGTGPGILAVVVALLAAIALIVRRRR